MNAGSLKSGPAFCICRIYGLSKAFISLIRSGKFPLPYLLRLMPFYFDFVFGFGLDGDFRSGLLEQLK